MIRESNSFPTKNSMPSIKTVINEKYLRRFDTKQAGGVY